MRKILILLIVLIIQQTLLSQGNLSRTIEEVSNSTVFLHRQFKKDSATSGTGSIIIHNNRYFLTTASHVAKDIDTSSTIVFRLEKDKPLILKLISFLPGKKTSWLNHKIEDISILELTPYDSITRSRLKLFAFPSNLILNSMERLPDDLKTTMMGYPLIDLDLKYFSPIYLHCGAASGYLTSLRGDNKKKATFIYLDKPSIQGMSGGPVYISISIPMVLTMGKTLLVGIIHGTYPDNTGGKLAAISPAYFLLELLNTVK